MIMMKSNASTNDSRAKRQRVSPMQATTVNHLLSADLWCDVADFLPKTSCALLAVALTAPPASFRESGWKGQPNTVSRAIISSVVKTAEERMGRNRFAYIVSLRFLVDELCEEVQGEARAEGERRQRRSSAANLWTSLHLQLCEYYEKNSKWELMDFIDIPKSLASRLTDDDVGAVLVCIDAKSKLKRLKLTNCVNVIGHGLKPLEASTVLEELDLGLYRQFETPFWTGESKKVVPTEYSFREIKLSEGPVCDILDNVLRHGGSSFRRLQYPFEWYLEAQLGRDGNLAGIASLDIDQIMRSRRMKEFVEGDGYNATLNLFSCCIYFNYADRDELCSYLRRNAFVDFDMSSHQCMKCNEISFAVCSHCDEILCKHCAEANECYTCRDVYCPRCENDGFSDVSYCNDDRCQRSNKWFCKECRLDDCRYTNNNCSGCKAMAFETLLNEMDAKEEELDRSKSVMFTSNHPPITLRFKEGEEESLVTIERSTTMETLLQAYADKFFQRDVGDCRLTFRGELIQSSATPESLGLHGMEEIEVVRI